MDISSEEDSEEILVQHGPETLDEWKTRLLTKLNTKFSSMNNIGKESDIYRNQVHKIRAIVDVQKIVELFQKCQLPTCSAVANVKANSVKGGVLKIEWVCGNSHHGSWVSSEVLCEKKNQKVFVNTLLMAAGILLKCYCSEFFDPHFFSLIKRTFLPDLFTTNRIEIGQFKPIL
jgi:hypothetical protein